MAKGDGFGAYSPSQISEGTPQQLIAWAMREFQKIAQAITFGLARRVEFRNVEPARPREGDVVGADGTNWDPGSGQGVYAYYAGAWHKLG